MNREFLVLALLISSLTSLGQSGYTRTLLLMGSRFDITVVAEDEVQGNAFIDMAVNEITRIERLISSWDSSSQTALINKYAGITARSVDTELFNLIDRAIRISKLTDGAFDISYASMDRLWRFDGTMEELPDAATVATSISKVGYEKIQLDPEKHTVFLTQNGMKIGFGAIGKGYAADKAKSLLISKGVVGGIINASGDMNTWGKQPDGTDWMVAITNPMDKTKSYGMLPISQRAVVTSGNYEKYVMINGVRHAHIIDPRTGYPVTGIQSATVFAPKAEIADALATAVFVMGVDSGLHLINQLPETECILISNDGGVHMSENIKIEVK